MCLYFVNPAGDAVDYMVAGVLGYIDTPGQGNRRPPGVLWCADNGAFSNRWKADRWWAFLERNAADVDTCVFAVAPDVVGDAAATIKRSRPWMPRMRALGYPVAFVAQDGQEDLPVPWSQFDALFIGGTTDWKLGPEAAELAREAKRRGKWVHMGRVNSRKRYLYARSLGCDSVDGTYLIYQPSVNLPKLLRWLMPPLDAATEPPPAARRVGPPGGALAGPQRRSEAARLARFVPDPGSRYLGCPAHGPQYPRGSSREATHRVPGGTMSNTPVEAPSVTLTDAQTKALASIAEGGTSAASKATITALIKNGMVVQDGTGFKATRQGAAYLRVEEKIHPDKIKVVHDEAQWYKAEGDKHHGGFTQDVNQAARDEKGEPIKAAPPTGKVKAAVDAAAKAKAKAKPDLKVVGGKGTKATAAKPKAEKPKAKRGTAIKWGKQDDGTFLIRIPKLMRAWILEHASKRGPENKVRTAVEKGKVLPNDQGVGITITDSDLATVHSLAVKMREERKGKDRNAVSEAAAKVRRMEKAYGVKAEK